MKLNGLIRRHPNGWLTYHEEETYEVARLEGGKVYSFRIDSDFGPYLEENVAHSFDLPKKLYGNLAQRANRVLASYRKQGSGRMAVAAIGQKGSGKTLLAKKIAVDSGLPIIVVAFAAPPTLVDSFLESVGPHVLFLDEFEKTFEKEDLQNLFLSVLDGTSGSSRLTIITANDKRKLADYFLMRPGRIRFLYTYEGLERQFILEYLDDVLRAPEEYRTEILERCELLRQDLNFDILRVLVEEANDWHAELSVKDIFTGINCMPADAATEWVAEFSFNRDVGVDIAAYRPYSNLLEDLGEGMSISDLYVNMAVRKVVPSARGVPRVQLGAAASDEGSSTDALAVKLSEFFPQKAATNDDGVRYESSCITIDASYLNAVNPRSVVFEVPLVVNGTVLATPLRDLGLTNRINRKPEDYGTDDLILTAVFRKQKKQAAFRWYSF